MWQGFESATEMAETATVVDGSAFRKRSLGKQVLFAVLTAGLYSVYWFYVTAKQFDAGTDRNPTPILAFVPGVNLLTAWQISGAAEAVTDRSQVVLFLLFLVFAPLSWYWIQSGINGVASN